MPLDTGARVGDYEILSLLGAGGMGQVYSARNIISGRIEAMKILLPDLAAEPGPAARFTAEIRILADLEHPNIAQLRTAFEFENRQVMIMEFVQGVTLEKRASESPLPLDDALNFATQVLDALSYAHSKGVIHRDIKPANIMLTSQGLVKLMDFGIAKSTDFRLTLPGKIMGSVNYMPPEQVRGGTVDARSDIYSFGATLYEMLTGRPPFQAGTAYTVLNAQLNEAPVPPSQVIPAIPLELNNIVLRAMVKAPDGRFQSAEEFRSALGNLNKSSAEANAAQPVVMPVSAANSAAQPSKSHRGLWLGIGAAAAIVAMVLAATLLPGMLSTHAGQKPAVPSAIDNTPAAKPSNNRNTFKPAQPPANPLVTLGPGADARSVTATAQPGHLTAAAHRDHPRFAAQPARTAATPQPPPGPSPQEIAQVRERMIELGAQADAARNGIQQIRNQQQAQGLDLRGDILASMNRMDSYLNEANSALSQNELQAANDNMDRAEKELATLDTFLGR